LLLEELRLGKVWPAFVLPVLMLVWSNIHGGFVAGLGTIAVYTAFAVFGVRLSGGSTGVPSVPPEGVTPNRVSASRLKTMVAVAIACGLVTLINIYGIEYWRYLVPALLHKRPQITEWQPLPLLGNDSFHALRILTAIVAIVLLVAWRRTEKRSWSGLVMLVLTALLAWRSRRHAPFFAVATMAFAGPFLETALRGFAASLPQKVQVRLRPSIGLVLLHGLVAIYVAFHFLPRASFTVLAPVGEVPVRETDILSRAQIEGNVATPFGWGGYCAWRLYPRIKVSLDSRYETTYPDSTFEMNSDFYAKSGTNWDRLVREYPVDFVILDILRGRLRPEDLRDHGYTLIWVTSTNSVLMSLEKHAAKLRQVAADLPPTTIDPVDAAIPDKWWLK
jgi:hypothetical protein